MRAIKFRAWDGGEMSYDVLSGHSSGNVCDVDEQGEAVWFWHEPPQAVMQFTGLKDKKGREIYEGDIIKDSRDALLEVYWHENKAFYALRLLSGPEPHGKFNSEGEQFSYGFIVWHDCEVIGNVYENPELVKK